MIVLSLADYHQRNGNKSKESMLKGQERYQQKNLDDARTVNKSQITERRPNPDE
jgi:hypothetical protein